MAVSLTELDNIGKACKLSSEHLLIQDNQVYDFGVQRGDFHSRDMNISGIDWAHIPVRSLNGENKKEVRIQFWEMQNLTGLGRRGLKDKRP